MVHDISIAPAAPADVEAVRSISAAAYTPAYLAAIGAVPKPATEDYVPRIALKQVWILAVAGRPAGLIVLEPVGGDLLIYSVAVHPDHQGHGFAKELIAFAGERAKLGGCGTLRLYTNARMLRNVALYRAAASPKPDAAPTRAGLGRRSSTWRSKSRPRCRSPEETTRYADPPRHPRHP